MSDNPNEQPPASAAADQYASGGTPRKPDTYGQGPVGPKKQPSGNPRAASNQSSAAEKYGH